MTYCCVDLKGLEACLPCPGGRVNCGQVVFGVCRPHTGYKWVYIRRGNVPAVFCRLD